MKTYETKLGTAKIVSKNACMVQGKWGVMATINGKKAFLTFDGKPELEAAYPVPKFDEFGEVEAGHYVKDGRIVKKQFSLDRDE